MSSATQTPFKVLSARNNKHVSSACRSCQSKHIKCDGNQVSACSQCAQRQLECVWAVEQDGRIARGGECYKCPQLLAYISHLEAQLAATAVQQNFDALQTHYSRAEPPHSEPALFPLAPFNAQPLFTQPDTYANYGQFGEDAQPATFPLKAQATASTSEHRASFLMVPTQAFPEMEYGHFDQGNIASPLNGSTFTHPGPLLHPAGDGQYHARREDERLST